MSCGLRQPLGTYRYSKQGRPRASRRVAGGCSCTVAGPARTRAAPAAARALLARAAAGGNGAGLVGCRDTFIVAIPPAE